MTSEPYDEWIDITSLDDHIKGYEVHMSRGGRYRHRESAGPRVDPNERQVEKAWVQGLPPNE